MNKGIYRLIFNKARGLLMVVGELATNMTKSSLTGTIGTARLSSLRASFSSLRFACLLALGHVLFIGDVHARILVDRSAPSSQQATVLSAANGVPQVNIQTPTAGGVSRNQYTQFDVNSRGVILNNSRTTTSSQLGGIVSANPHLITGTARIIVNEVNSTNPSLLNGHIEVAGTRADVVFANPAGISCSGCGFINATKATLTTGKPTYSNGHLNGYRVQSGTVQINGDGLDTSTADYTQIIARSVKVNANIWANDLSVTAGANQVSSDATTVTEISPVGAQPNFAIDVSSLGGMYAGKIRLVGTENGVGVRHAGDIGAGVGGLTLSADGRLEHSGSTSSEAALAIQVTDDIRNTGTLYAGDKLAISTNKNIQQDGIAAALHSVSINAQGHLSGQADAVLAAGINSNGVLTSSNQLADIDVNVKGRVDLQGQQIALNDIRITGQAITLDNSVQQADHLGLDARTGDVTMTDSRSTVLTVDAQGHSIHITDSDLSLNQATLIANKNSIDLTQSTLLVQQELTLNAVEELVTDSATVLAESLNVQANRLSNRKGLIQQSGSPSLELQFAGNVDNTDGTILSNSELTIATDHLHNESGEISSAKALVLNVRSHVDNTQGIITSTDTATINSGEFNNDQGRIQSVKTLSIDTNGQALINTNSDNTAGVISGDALDITASTLNNNAGYIGAQQTLSITTTADSSNVAGVIESADSLTLNTAAFNNDQGRLQSAQALSIDTNSNIFINTNSGNTAGVISGDGLDITASTLNNNAGYIGAQQTLSITTTADSSNVAGVIESADSLTLNTAAFNNDQGRLQSAKALSIDTNGNMFTNTNSSNTAGVISGDGLDITASTLNNNAGYIGAQQTLSVTTTVDSSNVAGVIESADSLTLNTAAFNNDQGRIQSSKALSIDTNSNIFINTNSGNTAGVISGDGLDITASTLNNNAGYIGAQQTLSITTTADSSNVAGVIESADSLTLNTAAFNNDQGRLQSAKALSIDTNGNMFTNTNSSNTAGVISGDGVDITAGSLNNDEGYIGSQKVLRVTSLGNYTNKSGIIESVEKILLEAETFNNDLGHIQSFDDVSIVTTGNASNVLGNIFASGDIGIRTAAFNNQQGLIQSNNNPNSPNSTYNISINTNNHVFNNAQTSINGGVVSSGEISLLASSVDNTTGYIGAKKNILLTANGSNSNRSGQIEAQQNLNFNSGELDNSGGSIRAKEDVLIATRVGTSLTNAYSGSNGGIRSGGYLNLSTDALNNTEGHIESSKYLAITARANTTNTLGKIISTEKLAINGRNINNHQGRIQSADDMNINTNGNTLTNTASGNDKGIISAGKLQITSGALNNSSGYIGALIQKMPNTSNQYQLQGADITIRSQGLTNSFGHVRSASDLLFTNTGSNTSLVNSSGFLVANKVLDIQDASSNKTFKISNTSGELTAGEQIKLNVQQLLGKGNVLSAGSILVNLVGDYVHQNDFVADTDLTLNVTGTLQNYNRLSANNTLNITSATLVNHNNAELSAINTNLSVSGTLTNRGLIDATNDTSIQANRLNNYGTGRIYGDHVSIKANALYNYAESSKAAVIAARTELDLGVGTLGNSGGSLIYSDGSASIAGNIVGGQASGRAGTITNNNSTIEAAGTLSINANRLDNLSPGSYTIKTNGKVTTQSVRRLQRGILDNGSLHKVGAIYDVNGTNTYFDYRHGERQARIPTGQYDDYYDYVVTRTTTTPTVTRNNNLIAKVISGSNMSLIVGTVNNTYSNITAGGRISAQVASLKNAALTGTETTRDKGKIYGYYSADNYSVENYTGPITSRTVSLSASVYQGSKNASTRYGISANQLSKKGADLSNNLTNRTVRSGFSAISLAVKDNSKTRRNNIGVAINASAQRNKSGVQRNNSQINGRENFQFTEIAGARGTIRSSNTVAIASNNSLFIQNTRPTATYLVETDPRFTSTRQYLSSELVTQQVAVSPNITNKRLGDGFYEQRIVREQIVELTGRRFLDNYSSDETQYQDLLNNGVSFAKAYNLRPGIALSERQMENLTQDIVWLEAQDVMLSNGTTQQVLVPKVYTVVSKGDLLPSGSLISGDSIDIASTGTIDNGGDFIARDGIALKAKDIKDLGGRLQASATVNATNDIILEGSQWRVDDSLELTAGRDITMRTTSSTSDLGQEGTRTIANQRATLEVRGYQ